MNNSEASNAHINVSTDNNLSTLNILFLIKGILSIFGSLFCLLYAAMGSFFFIMENEEIEQMPFNPGVLFIVFGGIGFILVLAYGIATIYASIYTRKLKNYNFIFVMSILSTLTGLLGIGLGIFALIELSKPEVKALFDQKNHNQNEDRRV